MPQVSNNTQRSSWWGSATATTRPNQTPTRRPATPTAPRDRANLSTRGGATTRGGILQRARSSVSSFFGTVSDGISDGANSLSGGIQRVSDFLGDRVGDVARLQGALQSGTVRAGSSAVAGVLDLTGQDAAAQRVRRAGRTASEFINSNADQAGDMASSFVSGVGDGVGGLVEGVGTAVANPVQTLEGLNRLNQVVNPVAQVAEVVRGRSPMDVLRQNQETVQGIVDGVRDDYRRTGEDHGGAGQVGRAAFDIITTVFTGGSGAAGRTGLRATTSTLDDIARASRATARGDDIARVSRGTGRADDVTRAARRATSDAPVEVGRTGEAIGGFLGRRMNGPLAPVADRLTRAAERLSEAGVQRAQRLEQRTRARGAERVRRGEVPGADGAQALNPARGRANALRRELGEVQEAWTAGGARRDELLNQLPESTRRRVRELESSGQTDQALEVLQRNRVEGAIRDSLDEVAQVDELYPSRLPDNVDPERVLAVGRRDSLEFMLRDPALSADGLRRNFRHIVGDSDVTGPVYIQDFRQGDRVGRAFSTSAGRQSGVTSGSFQQGGYFGSADDVRLSRSQIQARNALGLDNHADRFATFTIPEDTYGVVSRIGEQFENYGGHAVGGNVQITFPGSVQPANPSITSVGRVSQRTQRAADITAGTGYFGQTLEDNE